MKIEQGKIQLTEYPTAYEIRCGSTHMQFTLEELLYLYAMVKAVIDMLGVDVTGKDLIITHHPDGRRELILK